jgi:hypothetical protein
MKKPNQATLVWRVFTVLALISQSALASITLFSDNFQSYPVQNPAPNPLTNGPAGGQWYFVDPTPPMTVNKHRVLDGVTGAGLDSRYWESMTNNARLTNAITISALPAGSEPYTFRLSFLVASDTGTAGRPVTFKYAVSSSAGTLSFVSGGNLDSSQTLTNLSSYGSASSGTLGKSLDRRFIIVFQGTGLSVGDNIIFDITRVTNSGSALWMTLDDVSLTVDDGTGPQVQSARPMLTLEHVRVTFSEPVEAASATSTTNYSFSGSALSVLNARLIDPATVELQTSSQTPSSSYSLQVSNVGGQTGISMTATQMNFTTPALVVSSVRYDAGTSSDGPSDPTSAVAGYWNFTTNSANPGLTFSAVTNDISTGLNAWKVRDQSASAGTLVYRLPIDSASDALARDNGWRLLVNARMVANFGATSPSSVVRYNRGGWRYGIWFHLTASGDLTAQLLGITTVYTLTALGTGTAAYHTHVLVFDPATGTASYYFDGQPIIKNYAGESDTTEDGLTFGAASSAGQGEINFNRVQFDVVGGTPPVVTLNPQSSTNGVGQKVTFTAGFTPFVGAYQWLSNGVIIAGATNNVYTTGYITLLMDGTQYKCRALHALGNVETTTATLTVTSDTTPPTIANAKGSLLLDRVTIAYSEPVLENYATNIANYVWSLPGVTNISAKLLDPLTVELRTTPQQGGSNYTILVSNVRDSSNLIITPNSPATFKTATLLTQARYYAGNTTDAPAGPPDPTSPAGGNWTLRFDSDPGLSTNAVADDLSTGWHAWQVRDASTQNADLFIQYTFPFTTNIYQAAGENGWIMSVRSRVAESFGTAAPGALQAQYDDNNFWRYRMAFDQNTAGNLTVGLWRPSGYLNLVVTSDGMGGLAYHLHQVVYNPATTNASYYFDGELVTNNWAGGATASGMPGLYWGASATANEGCMNFNLVEFKSVEPPPKPFVAIGLNGANIEVRYTGILDMATQLGNPTAWTSVATNNTEVTNTYTILVGAQTKQYFRTRFLSQ